MSDATATETTEARPNTVTITDIGHSRRRLSIEVPAETVTEKLRESLETLSVEAQMPGFRKGKAPKSLLEKRFGSSLRQEARGQLVASAYAKAIEEHKLRVVGEPFPEAAPQEPKEGQPLRFNLEVEVMPEFDLPNLDGILVRRPTVGIPDEMVEGELKKYLINEGRLEERQTPEPGDYLTGHGVMKGPDGTEFHNIKGCVVQVPPPEAKGEGMILGVKVADFSKQFGLPKPGETVTVRTTGPESHEVAAVRGTPLTITFNVERVDRIIPASMTELLASGGFESEDQVRELVRGRLMQRAAVQQQVVMRQQIAKYLIENTNLELPERLSDQQARRALERRRMELMYAGVEPRKIEERLADLRAASAAAARGELKLFFIMQRAADYLQVSVTEQDVSGRIAQIAADRGVRPEQLRQEIIQRNEGGTIFNQVREHKAMDAILERARVEDVSADDFNKIMREGAGSPETAAARD